MTRWFMIAITLLGLIMAMLTRSPGLLGIALLMTVIGLVGSVFSLAASRISANSRPDVAMLPPEALRAIRDKAHANSKAATQRQKTQASRPSAGSSAPPV